MRVLFSSTRGTGHLQPLLPYARALRRQNHEVLVAGPEELSAPLRSAGFAHAAFGHPGDAALSPIWARLRGIPNEEALVIVAREIFAGLNAQTALPRLLETIDTFRPDVIVRDSVEFAAVVAAESRGLPHVAVQVHVSFVEERLTSFAVEPIDALRQQAGLAPDGGASLHNEPTFSAFPASLDDPSVPTRLRAPMRMRMIDDEPTSDKSPWIKADGNKPLLYITFGTIVGSTPHVRSIYRTALDAVADLPVHALLTTGHGLEPDVLGAIPENVQVEAWIPQRDILPHAHALVCHGGSGTVLGALAAGVPMVITPLGADQPDNAQRVAAVGAGLALPAPDAHTLRAAIEQVLADPELRRGARRLADEMASMASIERAVDALASISSNSSP
jgi:UDP:flavonoid glycosyltransferase YjiC (YdhE family)